MCVCVCVSVCVTSIDLMKKKTVSHKKRLEANDIPAETITDADKVEDLPLLVNPIQYLYCKA